MPFVQLATYLSVAVGVIAMLTKALRYIKAPEHFRWELYPVPHEKGRAEYGGSFLEELDWWSKPRKSDRVREILEMMQEILLLKGVYHNNKRVWTFSLPFHLGLYLCIGWLILLVVGGIMEGNSLPVNGGAAGFGSVVHYLTLFTGYAGLILSGIGALGLLVWRLSDAGQRVYNAPADYINLILFDVVVAVSLIACFTSDPDFALIRAFAGSLATFAPATVSAHWVQAEIYLVSLMILYIPLTRMSHFVAKYFLYHSIRWNDEPNFRGSDIEKNIVKLLGQRVGWKAPHIHGGQPWTDVVKGDSK